jgi:hypothetical protein
MPIQAGCHAKLTNQGEFLWVAASRVNIAIEQYGIQVLKHNPATSIATLGMFTYLSFG